MISRLLLIVLIFAAITSCGRSDDLAGTSDSLYFQIEIPEDFHWKHMTVPDSVFTSVQYIPLETTEQTVFSLMWTRFLVRDSIFYILDRSSKTLLCFDLEGNFLRKHSFEGRGPGEFVRADDFDVKNGEFHFLTLGPNRIMRYNSDFELIGSHDLSFSSSFLRLGGSYYYLHSRISLEEKYSVHVIDTLGNLHNRYFEFDKTALHSTGIGMTSHNDTVYAIFYNDYNIYQLNPDGYSVFATLDFGKDNVSDDIMKESNYPDDRVIMDYVRQNRLRPPIGLGEAFVSDEYLIVRYTSIFLNRYLIFNRKDGSRYDQAITNTAAFPIVRGARFMDFKGNSLFDIVTASTIVKAIERGDGVFPDELKSLSSSDNPVIVVYNLK